MMSDFHDSFSYSEPERTRIKHLELELEVVFEKRILRGIAILNLDNDFSGRLVLDTRDLAIEQVEYRSRDEGFRPARFEMGPYEALMGSPLFIHLPELTRSVRIQYSTGENASGLQWLEAAQTSAKKFPFLFTQSEATHARSWIPIQDTPQVRMTYEATVQKPEAVKAVMSAPNNPHVYRAARPHFRMPYPIPAYLLALAVGDIDFQEMSARTGVFSESPMLGAAAHEMSDLDLMLCAAEELFGPYRWDRYDVLVLPPSFPVGGMENPCLTFVTPTIIAGDKSLTSLIAHEVAHSWSSNLVTNATWADFWINEGFTVYMERRILEKLYGQRRSDLEAVLGMQALSDEFATLSADDQALRGKTRGRDPNAITSHVPYEKGALFLRTVEMAVGREVFDNFLRSFFSAFAFTSITTSQFIDYLESKLLKKYPDRTAGLSIEAWIYGAGIPNNAELPKSDALDEVKQLGTQWVQGNISVAELATDRWSTHEWLRFLQHVSPHLDAGKMEELDREFRLTESGNAELLSQWLVLAIRNDYAPAFRRLEDFLNTVGRRKYLKTLYGELAKKPHLRSWAQSVYEKARPRYHPISREAVQSVLLQP